MKERKRCSYGITGTKVQARVSNNSIKRHGGRFKVALIVLLAGLCLSGLSGTVFATDNEANADVDSVSDYFAVSSEGAATQDITVNEDVTVSDTEQFLRWHSTAFGTAWYHWNSPQSVIEAADGSYVAAGFSAPGENKAFTQHAYITKFNKNGTIAWDRVYGGGADGTGTVTRYAHYKFLKVIQLANGDYLAIGDTNDALAMPVNGYSSIFAVRIDNNGNTLWQKAYGLKDKETNINAWDAAENEDGSISLWGNYWSKYNGYDRGYPAMIELDISSGGNLLNEFLVTDDFGDDATTDATSCTMNKTADGGFIAYQNTFDARWSDSIVKLNTAGQREWGIRLLPNESSTGYDRSAISNSKIVVLSDGYLVAGITTVKNAEGVLTSAPIVYKIDLTGNVKWTKIYQNLTLTNRATNVFAYKTTTDDVLLSVENGYSTVDFTVLKLGTAEGNVQWVKSYGNKTGFERNYGGNANFKMLENSAGQLIGVGNNYITKFAGDGGIAFVTDDFMTQSRTNYAVSDVATTILNHGVLEKRSYPENVVMEKDISLLTGLSSHDIRVVAEGGSLQSIAITTPATKLSYKVGDTLDISGLVVTGTYSDGTTKIEMVTTANITGFNSAAVAANQVLTITINGQTVTYMVQIEAAGEPGIGEFVGFLGQDPAGHYYLYNKVDFNNSYLAYQFNPDLAAANMYKHYLNNQCRIIALNDLTKGYMDYNAAATASLLAQMQGKPFDINVYFGRSDAKLYEEIVVNVKIVDKDGNIS